LIPKMKYKLSDGVTQSILGNFVQCRELAFKTLNEWEKPGVSRPMEWGNIFHRLDQLWCEEIRRQQLLKRKNIKINTGKIFTDYEAEYRKVALKSGTDMAIVEEDFAMAEPVWDHYTYYWEREEYKRKWLGLESTFDVQFAGYRLRGQRDGVFEIHKKASLWLKETKTKGKISVDSILAALGFDFQNLFYITASEVETGRKIKGVLYNIVRRPGLKRGKDSLTEYCNRIFDHIEADPEHYFKRFEITYSKEVVEDFQQNELPAKLHEFYMWLNGKLPTYKNQRACMGQWYCQFLKACGQRNMRGYKQTAKLFRELTGR